MTAEEHITWTITALAETLALPGWPRTRREDLAALVAQLTAQWQQYQTGMLRPTDAAAEV